ncbi:MAG: hypothetical protein US20_C0005G0024 [Candidatus Pacebacteria bacterium GW2011_GWF1_36_5]|nr:MAG: hypothetical protein US20_C0005G0024 [Candidatus Pacebacteria bacterium GW2011_GWF1_36_5]
MEKKDLKREIKEHSDYLLEQIRLRDKTIKTLEAENKRMREHIKRALEFVDDDPDSDITLEQREQVVYQLNKALEDK